MTINDVYMIYIIVRGGRNEKYIFSPRINGIVKL